MFEDHFVFTRYLYEKEEVMITLVMSILNRKEESIFWGYELYYSGFQEELFEIFWKIYYTYYATLNPKFEQFLHQKIKTNKNDPKIVSIIINNFMLRPHNCDVFILFMETEEDNKNTSDNFELLLENNNYFGIYRYISMINDETQIYSLLEKSIDYFMSKGLKIKKEKLLKDYKNMQIFLKTKVQKNIDFRHILIISRIMHYYSLLN